MRNLGEMIGMRCVILVVGWALVFAGVEAKRSSLLNRQNGIGSKKKSISDQMNAEWGGCEQ